MGMCLPKDRLKALWFVPKCPACRRRKYKYGTTLLSFAREFFPDFLKIAAAVASGNVAVALANGIPFLGVFQTIKHGLDGIPSSPLLRCLHCFAYVIICPHCTRALVLEDHPRTGTLLTCKRCQGTMSPCERYDWNPWGLEQ